MNTNHSIITSDNLIRNGHFTDLQGNASTEHWSTNTASQPVRIPGGHHTLSLDAREFIAQKADTVQAQNFKVHYSFLAAATHPSPGTYINVRVANDWISEQVDMVVNNQVLYLHTHTGSRMFSAQGGPLQLTFANQVLNAGRFIELTDIKLWIEPVHD